MLNVQSVAGNNVYKMNFKADDRRQYRQSQPIYVDRQQAELERMQKEQKKQKRRNNILTTVSIGAMLAIIIGTVFTIRGLKGGGAKAAEDALKDVKIEWKIFDENNKVAPLTSKTTSKAVRNEFTKIINLNNLSDKAKKWAGITQKPRLYYMYGESGVGKTYAAEQFAQEIGAQYSCIKFAELGTAYQNTTGARVLNMFRKIADEASSNPDKKYVVCVDEIDSLLRKVEERSGNEASKDRSSVLTGMDELVKKCKNVVLIATSNYHPNSKLIDQASMRRFKSGKIEVPLPDLEQAEALLEMYMKGPEAVKDSFFKTSEFKNFAKKLVSEKYSNAEIQNIAEAATDFFGEKLVGVADKDIESVKFTIECLNKGKTLIGRPAALTNDTMKFEKTA